jgi:hypothetical protein
VQTGNSQDGNTKADLQCMGYEDIKGINWHLWCQAGRFCSGVEVLNEPHK